MPQPAEEGSPQGIAIPGLGGEMDAEILSLLVPATLAVFLDPAMALIDTGTLHVTAGWYCMPLAHTSCNLHSIAERLQQLSDERQPCVLAHAHKHHERSLCILTNGGTESGLQLVLACNESTVQHPNLLSSMTELCLSLGNISQELTSLRSRDITFCAVIVSVSR